MLDNLYLLIESFHVGMWVKGCKDFPHANQETNNVVESYHGYLKAMLLCDRRKKCSRRMDWLFYTLLKNAEPRYRFKETLKKKDIIITTRKRCSLNHQWKRLEEFQTVIAGLMRAYLMLIG